MIAADLEEKIELADSIWLSGLESYTPEVDHFTSMLPMAFAELEQLVYRGTISDFDALVTGLVKGAFLHITDAFNDEEVTFIKSRQLALQSSTPSTFYKMDGLIPDYWRDITPGIGKQYAVAAVKKAGFFFPWNSEKKLFNLINRRWRILKVLGGRPFDFGEATEPKDGVVDRIQIAQYEAGSGYLSAHQDPNHNQRMFISGYLSQWGVDFLGGGFWALDASGERHLLESRFNAGDMGAGSARIIHGVETITGMPHDKRWFLGLYTNDSDACTARQTWGAVEITK